MCRVTFETARGEHTANNERSVWQSGITKPRYCEIYAKGQGAWLWSRDCFKILPFVVMQRVARVCQRQLSYLFYVVDCQEIGWEERLPDRACERSVSGAENGAERGQK